MSDGPARHRLGSEAAVEVEPQPPEEADEQPLVEFTARNALVLAGFLFASLAALYVLLPQVAGLDDTWNRIEHGSPYWLFLALLFAVGMFAAYVAIFRGVFMRAAGAERVDWRASYQITLAGLAASRIFAAGGAGGLVLQAWALRRAGMRRREVADMTLAFLVITYMPYAAALVICGFGLRLGLFPGAAPFAVTVVPAILAMMIAGVWFVLALVPTDLERRLSDFAHRRGRVGRWAQKAANLPAAASAGMRLAFAHARSRDPALVGAIAFWAAQILVLWAAFRAFGDSPPAAVLVQAFFVGMLGNLLPMPGGVGGVEGGMIAALVAFEVDAGLAVVAVLVYRALTFWLPMVPGVIAYFQLRRTVQRWSLHYTK